MSRHKIAFGLLASGLLGLGACSVAAPPSGGSDQAPIIEAVSASKPSAEAQAALDACYITDSKNELGANGDLRGTKIVTGMAQISPARDAVKYVPLGNAPEIQSDKAVWVITVKGKVTLPLAEEMTDPTCVVVDGVGYWYATGDRLDGGELVTPMPFSAPPTRILPTLAP